VNANQVAVRLGIAVEIRGIAGGVYGGNNALFGQDIQIAIDSASADTRLLAGDKLENLGSAEMSGIIANNLDNCLSLLCNSHFLPIPFA
jgi:hypothetical protein